MAKTSASFSQFQKLNEQLGNPTIGRMQHLLSNGDLLSLMRENAHLLHKVDRGEFRKLLTPDLRVDTEKHDWIL